MRGRRRDTVSYRLNLGIKLLSDFNLQRAGVATAGRTHLPRRKRLRASGNAPRARTTLRATNVQAQITPILFVCKQLRVSARNPAPVLAFPRPGSRPVA
jgi:hypothetical protein